MATPPINHLRYSNCQWIFCIPVEELWCLFWSCVQVLLKNSTSEGFSGIKKACLWSYSRMSIIFNCRFWLGHSKNYFVIYLPFQGGLSGVLQIIVLLHNLSASYWMIWMIDICLQEILVEKYNLWLHQVIQDQQSNPRTSQYHYHAWLLWIMLFFQNAVLVLHQM